MITFSRDQGFYNENIYFFIRSPFLREKRLRYEFANYFVLRWKKERNAWNRILVPAIDSLIPKSHAIVDEICPSALWLHVSSAVFVKLMG